MHNTSIGIDKVNLAEKFNKFNEFWTPKIVGVLNDSHVKLAKFKDAFVWHQHEHEDELFFVTKGKLKIKLRDKDIDLSAGEFVIIPRGVEHLPIADGVAHVVLIEPKTTLNTGDAKSALTQINLERI